MNRIIRYAINQETGFVHSRVGSQICWPILNYEEMRPENNLAMTYHLEAVPVHEIASEWESLKWTRKIPTKIKNDHRQFWGMPLLPPAPRSDRQTEED